MILTQKEMVTKKLEFKMKEDLETWSKELE